MKIATWLATILLLVPPAADAQVSASASPATPLAIGDTFTIQSAVLGETRRVNVYAPPAYVASKDARLPVLYMPDGGMAEDFLHVAGLVQVSTGNGTMRPFLLVGIENTQRRRDLSGPTENADDRKVAPMVGGSAAFRQFIKSELMPLVTARYRTTGETAIMGESLAGLFVVETLYLEPDLFDTYIAFDPSLWWNNNAMVTGAAARLKQGWMKPRRLYLASSGEKQLAPLAKDLADALAAHRPANLTWHYQLLADETHATIYHPAALNALRTLFAPK
jgi:predicted alpha/beta superfamily hydrolase